MADHDPEIAHTDRAAEDTSGAADAEAAEAEPEAAGREPAGREPAAAPLTREDLSTSSPSARSRLFLAVLGVLVLGVIVGRLSASDDEGGDEEAPPTSAAGLPFPAGDQDRTSYWGFAGLVPVVVDAFDRPNDRDGLGNAATGQTWTEVAGSWAVNQRQARVPTTANGDRPAIAVVSGAQGDGLTEVTLPVVDQGVGLVFRYLDPANYWSVVANPETESWSVNTTVNGDTTLVSDVAASTANGVTISIVQDAARFRVLVDGTDVLLLNDSALANQLQGGLIAESSNTTARWDRFLVLAFQPPPPPTTAPPA